VSDPVAPPLRSREATRLLWVDRLARFPDTGLTVAAFCAAESVPVQSFFYWRKRLAGPAPLPDAPRFLPVRVAPAPAIEIVLPGGAVLRITPGCDPAFVRSLIDALTGAPC
jgi:transposase